MSKIYPYFSFENRPKEFVDSVKNILNRVIEDGHYILGRDVTEFEKEFANYLGVTEVVTVGNGFDSLWIALKALGIGKNDEVIVPAHTFIATFSAIEAVGATPIPVDVKIDGLLDLEKVPKAITRKTKAIVPVHMHGRVSDIPQLRAITQNSVFIVEDCAQAHGAELNGVKAGAMGDIGCFSFYPTKNLGGIGDGGAISVNSSELGSVIRSMANYGSLINDKYVHVRYGVNSRLDTINAAFLRYSLKHLDLWNAQRIEVAREYLNYFQKRGVPVLSTTENSVWHHFVVHAKNRDRVRKDLSELGIGTEIHYPYPAYTEYASMMNLHFAKMEVANRISANGLSLPLYPWLPAEQIIDLFDRFDEIDLPSRLLLIP